jgi:hypothetical protein
MSSDKKRPSSHDRLVSVPAASVKPSSPGFRVQHVPEDSVEFSSPTVPPPVHSDHPEYKGQESNENDRPTSEFDRVVLDIRAALEEAIIQGDLDKALTNNDDLFRRAGEKNDLSKMSGFRRRLLNDLEGLLIAGENGRAMRLLAIYGDQVNLTQAFDKARDYCKRRDQGIQARVIYRLRAEHVHKWEGK